ncbi:MAG: HTTM domain-containing protein [Crocinitomicaceae bacterium]
MMEIRKWLSKQVFSEESIAPLVVFRILFGSMMLLSTLRFMLKGWVTDLYITPTYFFTYSGFDWVKPFDEFGMFIVFGAILISCLFITIGLFYRFSALIFFIAFTYIELLDKTNYLNHYYFISLVAFLMMFLPANKRCSLDLYFGFTDKKNKVARWTINIIKFQLAVVYIFAGISKLNYEWLIEAQPLINWLKHQTDLPLIGALMKYEFTAFLFSWGGALFDLLIVFILLNKRFRIYGYVMVILFHGLTAVMFPIGVFPYVMIVSTLIFFSTSFHEKTITAIESLMPIKLKKDSLVSAGIKNIKPKPYIGILLSLYIFIQLLVPLRYIMYPGKLFWTEQGYRFSWRVMLIEKVGYAQFYIHEDGGTGKKLINNRQYLTPQQEKMMSTQPDMILQYAHHLRDEYSNKTFIEKNGKQIHLVIPKVTAEIYVSLFNKGSRLFIDPDENLSSLNRGVGHKKWIRKYEN